MNGSWLQPSPAGTTSRWHATSSEGLPDPILAELRRVSEQVLADEAAADADFARVLASQRAFSLDYAYWKKLAYLRPGARGEGEW